MRKVLYTVSLILSFHFSYSQAGSLDPSFNGNGKVLSQFYYDFGSGPEVTGQDKVKAIVIQADGKIIAVGQTYDGSQFAYGVTRYNTDGTIDNGFGINGTASTTLGSYTGIDDIPYAAALQADGKIIIAGVSDDGTSVLTDFALVRYNTDGTLDSSFDGDGILYTGFGGDQAQATALAIQTDGKIIAAGFTLSASGDWDFALARYNMNGSLDNSFDDDGRVVTAISSQNDELYAIAIQPDGRIVVTGHSYISFINQAVVARYNSDGSLDSGFDSDGIVTSSIMPNGSYSTSLALQTDDKIVIAGYTHAGANKDFFVARYNTNGSADNSFDSDGKVITAMGTADDYAYAVAIQTNGKIVVAGRRVSNSDPYDDFALARYNSNGSLDNNFDSDGKKHFDMGGVGFDWIESIAISGSRIYAGGYCLSYGMGGYYVFAVAAIQVGSLTLPLSLLSFNGHWMNDKIKLEWKTSSEQNTSHFIAERSFNGADFMPIRNVTAAGNSSSVKDYDIIDMQPGTINYYRLKMVDMDGGFTYSQVVVLSKERSIKQLSVYPNPAGDILMVETNGMDGKAVCRIVDALGIVCYEQNVELNGNTFLVDLKVLSRGIYFLIMYTKEDKQVLKFIKE